LSIFSFPSSMHFISFLTNIAKYAFDTLVLALC
jgi:hypothetical protein